MKNRPKMPQPRLDAPLPEATVTAAGLRVVRLLVGKPPQTVSDLIEVMGVTRTAVTEQLNELVAAGFVKRETERLPGRGRPRHLYRTTDAALLLLFADKQRLVVPAVWQAIRDIGGEKMMRDVLKRLSLSLADYYNRKVTSAKPEDRLREMVDILNHEGGLVEAVEEETGHLVMYKRSCPFISMVDEGRSICCVDLEMLNSVVGREIRRTACRHDGDPCCTFEIANGVK
jgi:DeoR family transcriptional regulator, suf operon transcriptional repressor